MSQFLSNFKNFPSHQTKKSLPQFSCNSLLIQLIPLKSSSKFHVINSPFVSVNSFLVIFLFFRNIFIMSKSGSNKRLTIEEVRRRLKSNYLEIAIKNSRRCLPKKKFQPLNNLESHKIGKFSTFLRERGDLRAQNVNFL